MEHAPSMNDKRCPICGGYIENGLCIECGYDEHLDGDLSINSSKPKKKHKDSLLDLILNEEDDPFSGLF